MAKKVNKTNAMRILDAQKIAYEELQYNIDDGLIDGHSVYKKLGLAPENFFKTLVTKGKDGLLQVFVIPVLSELDLKKAAKSVGEKNVEMLHVKELLPMTGYIRGGCSPVGMKKLYTTIFDAHIKTLDKVYVSGGRQGLLIGVNPSDLIDIVRAEVADIVQE